MVGCDGVPLNSCIMDVICANDKGLFLVLVFVYGAGMTDEEINISIAEHCGFMDIKEHDYQPYNIDPYVDGPYQVWAGINPETNEVDLIPDYCNDLSAMHEAENLLSLKDQRNYVFALTQTLETSPNVDLNDQFINIHATARQRAEAFLRAHGKWDETIMEGNQ